MLKSSTNFSAKVAASSRLAFTISPARVAKPLVPTSRSSSAPFKNSSSSLASGAPRCHSISPQPPPAASPYLFILPLCDRSFGKVWFSPGHTLPEPLSVSVPLAPQPSLMLSSFCISLSPSPISYPQVGGLSMQYTVAVVQCAIAQFAPEANLRKAEQFIQQAANQGAQLVVFPEDFVTGPINGAADFVDFTGHYLSLFQQLARRYQIDLVPGSIIEGDPQGWYNTTYYIDRSGDCKGRYRKANLWHPERSYLSPGNEFPVFHTSYGNVGLLICWDLAFPEA